MSIADLETLKQCYTIDTKGQIITMVALNCIMFLVYFATMLFTIHNTYKYLVKQKRYKTFTVGFFYLLSLVVLVTRMSEYIFFCIMSLQLDNWKDLENKEHQLIKRFTDELFMHIGSCQVIGDFVKTALGFFPVASMVELSLRLT